MFEMRINGVIRQCRDTGPCNPKGWHRVAVYDLAKPQRIAEMHTLPAWFIRQRIGVMRTGGEDYSFDGCHQ